MLNYKQDLCLALRACKRLDCNCADARPQTMQETPCRPCYRPLQTRCQLTGFARVWVQRVDQGGLGTLARARFPLNECVRNLRFRLRQFVSSTVRIFHVVSLFQCRRRAAPKRGIRPVGAGTDASDGAGDAAAPSGANERRGADERQGAGERWGSWGCSGSRRCSPNLIPSPFKVASPCGEPGADHRRAGWLAPYMELPLTVR